MKTESKKEYTKLKDPQGTDFYCPVAIDGAPVENGIIDACVERDVVERYSGNIAIRDS